MATETEKILSGQIKKLVDFLLPRSDIQDGGAIDNAIRIIQEQDKLKEWKQAIEDACITDWVSITTPRETIAALISWNIKMALDPAISKDANDLIAKTTAEKDERLKWWLETYDITMPCGHKNRYLATDTDGSNFCVMCESESMFKLLEQTADVLEAIKTTREKKQEEL